MSDKMKPIPVDGNEAAEICSEICKLLMRMEADTYLGTTALVMTILSKFSKSDLMPREDFIILCGAVYDGLEKTYGDGIDE